MAKKLFLVASLLLWVVATNIAGATSTMGDPTRPANWQPPETEASNVKGRLNLTQIIAFDGKGYAIINGQRYRVGDQVNGYTINRIVSQRVELQKGQQIFQITLHDTGLKKPAQVKEGVQ